MEHKYYNKSHKLDYKLYGIWVVFIGIGLLIFILI